MRFLCFTELLLVTGSSPCLFGVPRIPCATCSSQQNMAALDEPKSTTFDSGEPYLGLILSSSGSFHRERERSPCTALPPPAPLQALGQVYHVPRTPMTDARRYRSLFSHCRIATPTPPYHSPPPSDEEPSEGTIDPAAELEGDPDEPYQEGTVYPAGYDAYPSDTSYGSERESVSVSFAPSSRYSSDDSSASGSIGYGEASSGSASDSASDDDLVNRHFAGTFP
ncbi:hypothetical protein PIB30_076546 [Stylosanthes scabra]|uniref:Uncharacterized protein n=1 Tax=Stylosanthes scabra TaxID=79078 RepID=A0ABU6TPY3_9FABA|nr:hypothetical protein [Stylosanthes scabra]